MKKKYTIESIKCIQYDVRPLKFKNGTYKKRTRYIEVQRAEKSKILLLGIHQNREGRNCFEELGVY